MVQPSHIDEVKSTGTASTLSYLSVGVVGAGYTLNLRERELDFLADAKSATATH